MFPGVTRDRVSYDALWTGRRFVVQDTGGWEPDAKGLQQLVAEQASVAMRTADAVILVVDAVVGATAGDEAAARILRRSGKPVFLAANKVDSDGVKPTPPRCGRWGLVSRTRSAPCTDAAWPICSTRWSALLPEVAESASTEGRSAAGGAGRQAQRRQEFVAEPVGRR